MLRVFWPSVHRGSHPLIAPTQEKSVMKDRGQYTTPPPPYWMDGAGDWLLTKDFFVGFFFGLQFKVLGLKYFLWFNCKFSTRILMCCYSLLWGSASLLIGVHKISNFCTLSEDSKRYLADFATAWVKRWSTTSCSSLRCDASLRSRPAYNIIEITIQDRQRAELILQFRTDNALNCIIYYVICYLHKLSQLMHEPFCEIISLLNQFVLG